MTVDAGSDAPRASAGEGSSDALTYAFGDPSSGICGVARLGLAEGRASGLVLVFCGGTPVTVTADGGIETAASSWDAVAAAGLRTTTNEPLASWRLRFEGEHPLDLTFVAAGAPFELEPGNPAAVAGGMAGFDHVCRVDGTVGGAAFTGLGQRSRSWGAPDWERITMARTLSAWFDGDRAVSLVAIRPAGADEQDRERVAAHVLEPLGDGCGAREAVPRLSTTYDGEGRQHRAGLELHVGSEDPFARRLAGEVIAGTSLDLGRLRLDCAFFRWRMEGRVGIGRYDVLKRVDD